MQPALSAASSVNSQNSFHQPGFSSTMSSPGVAGMNFQPAMSAPSMPTMMGNANFNIPAGLTGKGVATSSSASGMNSGKGSPTLSASGKDKGTTRRGSGGTSQLHKNSYINDKFQAALMKRAGKSGKNSPNVSPELKSSKPSPGLQASIPGLELNPASFAIGNVNQPLGPGSEPIVGMLRNAFSAPPQSMGGFGAPPQGGSLLTQQSSTTPNLTEINDALLG